MTKREFLRLESHEQLSFLRDAAWQVDTKLNLFGSETVDALMEAAADVRSAEAYVANISSVSYPDFPAAFVRMALPACNLYLRYARYYREA